MNAKAQAINDQVNAYQRKIDEGHAIGAAMAAGFLRQADGSETAAVAAMLSSLLLGLDKSSGDCSTLSHEWMMEQYWGYHVEQHSSVFDECFEGLRKIGAVSRDKSLSYGDADYSIWVEEVVTQEEYLVHKGEFYERRVRTIYSECHCSCADDNVHVWVKDGYRFHCRRTRRVESEKGQDLGDWPLKPIDLRYGDCRDEGYSFSCWVGRGPSDTKVDRALHFYRYVVQALENLRMVKDALVDPDVRDLP